MLLPGAIKELGVSELEGLFCWWPENGIVKNVIIQRVKTSVMTLFGQGHDRGSGIGGKEAEGRRV